MKIQIQIDETVWQYELGKFNAEAQARIDRANVSAHEQHAAVMRQTPESKRTNFTPAPDFQPLTVEQFVAKVVAEREAASLAVRTADHIAVVSAQSPEVIARFAKVAALSDEAKAQLATQVDAIK